MAVLLTIEDIKQHILAGLDPNAKIHSKDDKSILQLSVELQNNELILLLFQTGADINYSCGGCGSAVDLLVAQKNIEILELFLKSGKVDFVNRNFRGATPLENAVHGDEEQNDDEKEQNENRNLEIVKLFIKYGADASKDNSLVESCYARAWDIASYLVDNNGQLDKDCLECACEVNHPKAIELVSKLLAKGMSVNTSISYMEGERICSPLYIALDNSCYDMVWRLMLAGANGNDCAVDIDEEQNTTYLPMSRLYQYDQKAKRAVMHKWSPEDHWRFPKRVRSAIKCTLLLNLRLKLGLGGSTLIDLCAFVASGWYSSNWFED